MAAVLTKPPTFPDAFQWDIAEFLGKNLPPLQEDPMGPVLKRSLKSTDPNMSVAVVLDDWNPDTYEIGNLPATVTCYRLRVQAMSKNVVEFAGATQHSLLARNVRRMMAGDRDLRTLLASNRDTYGTSIERFQSLKLIRQRFHVTDEIRNQFMFLSAAEILIETETV